LSDQIPPSEAEDAEVAELRRLVARGESASLEFKASLRYDFATQNVNRALTKMVAKTIAGFLNVVGGTLLIGVSDDGDFLGLQHDLDTLAQRNLDAFERTLRNSVASYLGVHIGPVLGLSFVEVGGVTVARVTCLPYDSPVFVRDGDRQEFYIRDGNLTRSLDVRTTHEYIRTHWPADRPITAESVRDVVSELLREHLAGIQPDALRSMIFGAYREAAAPEPPIPTVGEAVPEWLRVSTRRVLDLFLGPLARSTGWKRIYLISPWISDIQHSASLTSDQFLKRLKADGATVYVVTRPPSFEWHEKALTRLGATGRVNVALVPELHIKLYTALTNYGSFAMLGSANFTQQALTNREIGLLVNSYSDGRKLVAQLNYEAAQIYRLPDRELLYRASFNVT
jgi:Schlafen, AlbA_2